MPGSVLSSIHATATSWCWRAFVPRSRLIRPSGWRIAMANPNPPQAQAQAQAQPQAQPAAKTEIRGLIRGSNAGRLECEGARPWACGRVADVHLQLGEEN
ncbi:MAG: hypothetical protein IPK13_11215 [Deltaproteobacteria bacterium]|nr:hypothetical protein [Deltaproteobacteria bacterium]